MGSVAIWHKQKSQQGTWQYLTAQNSPFAKILHFSCKNSSQASYI